MYLGNQMEMEGEKKEWNEIKYFFSYFKIKEQKFMKYMQYHRRNEMDLFYNNITIVTLFKNKWLNVQGYYRKFSVKFIKLNFIPPNFGRKMKE